MIVFYCIVDRSGSILRAAVDVSPVLEEVPHDAQPAPCAGLVQGTVTRVVTVVDIADLVFQTVQHHFLVAQAGRSLQQGLTRILVDDEAAGLGRHGPAGGGLGRGAGHLQRGRLGGRRGGLQPLIQLLLVGLGR